MVNKRVLYPIILILVLAFALVFTLSSFGIVNASPTVVGAGIANDTDNFYTPEDAISFLVTTVVGLDNATAVYVNLTRFNSTACGSTTNPGYLNLTNTTTGNLAPGAYQNWSGTCTIASLFNATSFFNGTVITPIAVNGGNFTFVAYNASEAYAYINGTSTTMASPIYLHNLGVPSISTSCMRLDSTAGRTTNMSLMKNFSAVNFNLFWQINFSCLTNGAFNSTNESKYLDAMSLNLTSVNMSDSTIGAKLAALSTAIQINISWPRTFNPSRIFINSTLFAALNTSGNVTLYNIPFIGQPNVSEEGSGVLLNGPNVTWSSSGYNAVYKAYIGNLTFAIYHFSGYAVNDSILPFFNITNPQPLQNFSNTTKKSVVTSVVINGTGTEVSYVNIQINSSLRYFFNSTACDLAGNWTSTSNTANCTNLTDGRDYWNCTVVSNLGDGNYTVNVSARDFGSTAGNLNSTVQTFRVDGTGPVLTLVMPLNGGNYSNSTLLNMSVYDAGVNTIDSLMVYFSNASGSLLNTTQFLNQSVTVNGSFVYSLNYSTLVDGAYAEGTYIINASVNDSLNNWGWLSSITIKVDSTTPALVFVTPTNVTTNATTTASKNITDVTIYYNISVVETNMKNLTVYLSNDTGTLNSSSVVNNVSGNFSWLSDGIYRINATACDYAGNCNSTIPREYNLTSTPVIWGLVVSNITLTSALITWNTDEATNASMNFGINYGLGTLAAVNLTFGLNHVINLTGLIHSTYYVNVTSCDPLGHCTVSTTSFLTSAPAVNDTTVASGGSGGSAATPSIWTISYYPLVAQLKEEYNKDLGEKNRVVFSVGNVAHHVGIISLTTTTATVQVASEVQEKTLNIGDEWKVDLNTTDSLKIYSVYVKLNGIANNKANLTMKTISEAYSAPITTTTPPSIGEKIGEVVTEGKESVMKNLWIWIVIVVLIVIIGIIIGFWKKIAKLIWVKTNRNKNVSVNLRR
jgi:hypothetical protein